MGCIGCGLIDSLIDQHIATSGFFGGPGLNGFGLYDSVGAPVYCDGVGELRTVPEHTSDVFSGSDGDTVTDPVGPGPGGSVAGAYVATTVTITNPSTVRACSVLLVMTFKANITLDAFSGVAFQGQLGITGDVVRNSLYARYVGWPPQDAADPQCDEFIFEQAVLDLPAGGSCDVNLGVSVLGQAATVEATVNSWATGLSAIAITK